MARAARRVSVLAWLRLARVFDRVNRASARHLAGGELSAAQCAVRARAGAKEGWPQRALAAALFVTRGNITQLLDRRERAGLIVRGQEGRRNRLFLTGAGRALEKRAVPAQET